MKRKREREAKRGRDRERETEKISVSPVLSLALSLARSPALCLSVPPSLQLSVMAQKPAAGAKPDPSAALLIEQGKTLYRAQRLKPALAKFEAALKVGPEND